MPVPVEAPSSSVFYYLKTLLVVSIKELVSNPTRRRLVGQLKSHERSLHACRHRSFGKGCRGFASNLMTRLLKLGICV
jgi:hypothetical protein